MNIPHSRNYRQEQRQQNPRPQPERQRETGNSADEGNGWGVAALIGASLLLLRWIVR